jgi:hypothetical protein
MVRLPNLRRHFFAQKPPPNKLGCSLFFPLFRSSLPHSCQPKDTNNGRENQKDTSDTDERPQTTEVGVSLGSGGVAFVDANFAIRPGVNAFFGNRIATKQYQNTDDLHKIASVWEFREHPRHLTEKQSDSADPNADAEVI